MVYWGSSSTSVYQIFSICRNCLHSGSQLFICEDCCTIRPGSTDLFELIIFKKLGAYYPNWCMILHPGDLRCQTATNRNTDCSRDDKTSWWCTAHLSSSNVRINNLWNWTQYTGDDILIPQARTSTMSMPYRVQRMEDILKQLESGDLKLRVRVLEVMLLHFICH